MKKLEHYIDTTSDNLHNKVDVNFHNKYIKEILHRIISTGNQTTIFTANTVEKKGKAIISHGKEHSKKLGQTITNKINKKTAIALFSLLTITSSTGVKEYNSHTQNETEKEIAIDAHSINNVALINKKKADFGDYIALYKPLHNYDKSTYFGRRIRTVRYNKNIRTALEKNALDIDFNSFQGLYMVEGEGNTASINQGDGGAGLLHIQPDVAQTDFHMKIFTDDPQYRKYDFKTLKKQGKSKAEIYKIHGEILKQIVEENDGQTRLANLDDRFHPQICLDKVSKRMEHDYIYAKKILNDKKKGLKEKEFKNYVENTLDGNIYQYAAINGFNKGTGSFTTIDTKKSGHHMENVHNTIKKIQSYNIILDKGIEQGLQGEELWQYIIEKINP